MPVTPDAGTLLETCAGAGATLVAIVGGLLVTRYVTLEAELSASRKRVHDLTRRLEDSRTSLASSARALETQYLQNKLEDDQAIRRILGNPTATTTAHLDDLIDFDTHETALVTDVLNAYQEEARNVSQFNWNVVPHTRQHEYWDDFRIRQGIKTKIDALWEYRYVKECEVRPGAATGIQAFVLDPATTGIVSASQLQTERDHLNRLIAARDEDEATMRSTDAELAAAILVRDSRERPPGLLTGLLVLAYLTVTSVVVPLLFLAPTPAQFTGSEAVRLLAVFFSGIVVLFIYMGAQVYRLVFAPT